MIGIIYFKFLYKVRLASKRCAPSPCALRLGSRDLGASVRLELLTTMATTAHCWSSGDLVGTAAITAGAAVTSLELWQWSLEHWREFLYTVQKQICIACGFSAKIDLL